MGPSCLWIFMKINIWAFEAPELSQVHYSRDQAAVGETQNIIQIKFLSINEPIIQ